MPVYNLTMVANESGIVPILQKVNTELMFDYYGWFILIAIAAIAFMAFISTTGDPKKSIASTMFIAFVMSIFLRAMELVPDLAIYLTLVGAGVSAAFLYITK